MKIRYANNNDFDFIIKGMEKNRILENRATKDVKAKLSDKRRIKQAIRKKNIRVLEKNGKPIAFLYFIINFKVMYIYDKFFWVDLIYVKESHRSKGLGKLLYKDAVKIAKKKGIKKIVIDVFNVNKNSLDFHKKIGFHPLYTIFHKKI